MNMSHDGKAEGRDNRLHEQVMQAKLPREGASFDCTDIGSVAHMLVVVQCAIEAHGENGWDFDRPDQGKVIAQMKLFANKRVCASAQMYYCPVHRADKSPETSPRRKGTTTGNLCSYRGLKNISLYSQRVGLPSQTPTYKQTNLGHPSTRCT